MTRFALPALLCLLTLAGCVYHQDIRQGNYLSADDIAQLKPGMTRKQVEFILGTPMVDDPFHANRWDYVYFLKPSEGGRLQEKHLVVRFDADGRVIKIEQPTVVPQPRAAR